MFKYRDPVRIISGFYENCTGEVIDRDTHEIHGGAGGTEYRGMDICYMVRLWDGHVVPDLPESMFQLHAVKQ